MNNQYDIQQARENLRKRLNQKGRKRRSRIHDESLINTKARLEALEPQDGRCGNCKHLSINWRLSQDHIQNPALQCYLGISAITIFRNDAHKPLTDNKECPKFEKNIHP